MVISMLEATANLVAVVVDLGPALAWQSLLSRGCDQFGCATQLLECMAPNNQGDGASNSIRLANAALHWLEHGMHRPSDAHAHVGAAARCHEGAEVDVRRVGREGLDELEGGVHLLLVVGAVNGKERRSELGRVDSAFEVDAVLAQCPHLALRALRAEALEFAPHKLQAKLEIVLLSIVAPVGAFADRLECQSSPMSMTPLTLTLSEPLE